MVQWLNGLVVPRSQGLDFVRTMSRGQPKKSGNLNRSVSFQRSSHPKRVRRSLLANTAKNGLAVLLTQKLLDAVATLGAVHLEIANVVCG